MSTSNNSNEPVPGVLASKSGVVITRVDVPNANGRTYPKTVIEEALSKLGGKPLQGTLGIDHKRPAFICQNFRLHGDALVCDAQVLSTPSGRQLMDTLCATKPGKPELVDFITVGVGQVRADGVVTEFELLGVSVVPKAHGKASQS